MLPKTIGSYRIVKQIGQGGMGVVFEAIHETIERRVAIKVLNAEFAKDAHITARLFNEARAINRIEHPSLVQVSDYGRLDDGAAYLVMEYLKGENLAKRLQRLNGRMPTAQILQFSWQIAGALSAAHEKNIIHRDLKPDNVMLVPDEVAPGGERAKVLDFGIAKLSQGNQAKTASSIIMGTPRYMSPEQCRGAGTVDAKTDTYSLGIMLYEMIAGRLPFVGEGSGELIGQHLFKEPPSLLDFAPTTPQNIVALVHKLLVKDRLYRPSMRELKEELETIIANTNNAMNTTKVVEVGQPTLKWQFPVRHSPNTTIGAATGQSTVERQTSHFRKYTIFGLLGGLILASVIFGSPILRRASSLRIQRQPALEEKIPKPALEEKIQSERSSGAVAAVARPIIEPVPPSQALSDSPRKAILTNPSQNANPTSMISSNNTASVRGRDLSSKDSEPTNDNHVQSSVKPASSNSKLSAVSIITQPKSAKLSNSPKVDELGKISMNQVQALYVQGERLKSIILARRIADQGGVESAAAWWFLAIGSCETRNIDLATTSHGHLESAYQLQKHIDYCRQNGLSFEEGKFRIN